MTASLLLLHVNTLILILQKLLILSLLLLPHKFESTVLMNENMPECFKRFRQYQERAFETAKIQDLLTCLVRQ
ncbi:hypothetical protein BDF20DRAFT_866217 [Mycotypha africana]|uniref:uncharacterized protein n=1 Tax=Mycotypha africana TaxID=64632 RepID=UPI00230033BD|nr:uncharacterized protein BDF20DRAFT_866217 [Mycotypha africana]KAI8982317.1 hypothetical protein BDF20DRAFT_866217 [Mycotypha africana]